jgi:hypothetical protein
MKTKVKWSIQKLLAREQRRLIRGWLRHVEDLNEPEEELIHICGPETGRNLNDEEEEERSSRDLRNCQAGEDELSNCQVGNGKRPSGGLAYCQEGSDEGSYCQVGNEMRSGDLIDCHVGSRKSHISRWERESR